MGEAQDKLKLARIDVDPYMALRGGKLVRVKGYQRSFLERLRNLGREGLPSRRPKRTGWEGYDTRPGLDERGEPIRGYPDESPFGTPARESPDVSFRGPEGRKQLMEGFRNQARELRSQIGADIGKLKPIGRPSELSAAMGLKPKQGVLVGTPLGTLVFAKLRRPSEEQLDAWDRREQAAKDLDRQALDLSWSAVGSGLTIGNRKPMEHGQRLSEMGLLDEAEEAHLRELEKFWEAHPDASSGVVRDDGSIEPIGGLGKGRPSPALASNLEVDAQLREERRQGRIRGQSVEYPGGGVESRISVSDRVSDAKRKRDRERIKRAQRGPAVSSLQQALDWDMRASPAQGEDLERGYTEAERELLRADLDPDDKELEEMEETWDWAEGGRASPDQVIAAGYANYAPGYADYDVGDTVVVSMGSYSRVVKVDGKEDDIKNGSPGGGGKVVAIEGTVPAGAWEKVGSDVWFYDSQVTRKTSPIKKLGASPAGKGYGVRYTDVSTMSGAQAGERVRYFSTKEAREAFLDREGVVFKGYVDEDSALKKLGASPAPLPHWTQALRDAVKSGDDAAIADEFRRQVDKGMSYNLVREVVRDERGGTKEETDAYIRKIQSSPLRKLGEMSSTPGAPVGSTGKPRNVGAMSDAKLVKEIAIVEGEEPEFYDDLYGGGAHSMFLQKLYEEANKRGIQGPPEEMDEVGPTLTPEAFEEAESELEPAFLDEPQLESMPGEPFGPSGKERNVGAMSVAKLQAEIQALTAGDGVPAVRVKAGWPEYVEYLEKLELELRSRGPNPDPDMPAFSAVERLKRRIHT